MSNHLASYTTRPPADGAGFDHEDGRALRLVTVPGGAAWLAWHNPRTLVTNPDGSPTHFPSAARAAKYLEEHHDNG